MATNIAIPNQSLVRWDLSGRIAIEYTRNPKNFTLPNYTRYVPCLAPNSVYKKLNNNFNRKVWGQGTYAWPEPSPRPQNATRDLKQSYVTFLTQRYSYPASNVGDIAQAAAMVEGTDLIGHYVPGVATQAMRVRTQRVLGVATTASKWQAATGDNNEYISADHTGTATSVGGGYWDAGSFANTYIAKTCLAIRTLCNKDTDGVLGDDPGKWFMLMNPNTAGAVSRSPEIRQTFQNNFWSRGLMTTKEAPVSKAALYNLPELIYGFTPVIEDATIDLNPLSPSLTPTYILADGVVLFIYRDGVTGPEGVQDVYAEMGMAVMSTLCMFYCTAGVPGVRPGEMSASAAEFDIRLQTRYREWDRYTEIAADENTFEDVTCPASGYLLTSAITGT